MDKGRKIVNSHAQVYKYIDSHFDDHVENVRRLVRQRSISFTNEGVEECANTLVQMIKDLGGRRAERCDFIGGHPVVYGEVMSKKPKAKTIIAYALYDVMPVDEDGWKVPPFSAEILEGTEIGLPEDYGKVIVGRGARNQKGPIVAFMNALKSMLEVEGDIPVNVLFALDGEEECMSPHFPEFIRRYEKRTPEGQCCLLLQSGNRRAQRPQHLPWIPWDYSFGDRGKRRRMGRAGKGAPFSIGGAAA